MSRQKKVNRCENCVYFDDDRDTECRLLAEEEWNELFDIWDEESDLHLEEYLAEKCGHYASQD